MAPLLLVAFVWATSRRIPKVVVLIGSVVSVAGLVLVVSPGAGDVLDVLGLIFAGLATIGCAIYYVVAARPSDGLPPVAFAAIGLLLGGVLLAAFGATAAAAVHDDLRRGRVFGTTVAWWIPLLVVGVLATGFAYASSITAAEILGSRLSSFVGLLEVVAAAFYAWILLGEALTWLQILGRRADPVGIAFVRSEKQAAVELEPAAEPAREVVGSVVSEGDGLRSSPRIRHLHHALERRPGGDVALAVLSEELGFDLVTFQDHPYQPRFLDTWTLMSWVLASTSRIRVAPNVLNLPLRPPAVVARAAASLDLLSGGRFELALGAGGFWDAIEAMGGDRLAPGESFQALEEASMSSTASGTSRLASRCASPASSTASTAPSAARRPPRQSRSGSAPRPQDAGPDRSEGRRLAALARLARAEAIARSNAIIDAAAVAAGVAGGCAAAGECGCGDLGGRATRLAVEDGFSSSSWRRMSRIRCGDSLPPLCGRSTMRRTNRS